MTDPWPVVSRKDVEAYFKARDEAEERKEAEQIRTQMRIVTERLDRLRP